MVDFKIADAKSYKIYQHATELEDVILGRGNADGQANPGENIAIRCRWRRSSRGGSVHNDTCIDNSARESDSWGA